MPVVPFMCKGIAEIGILLTKHPFKIFQPAIADISEVSFGQDVTPGKCSRQYAGSTIRKVVIIMDPQYPPCLK